MAHWSTTENEVVLTEYFAMLEQELAGQDYVKVRHNQRVQDRTGRSKVSVGFKFQNISAALLDLNAPWVEGYKPARNYQTSLAELVGTFLAERPRVLDLMRQNLEHPAVPRIDFMWNVVEPPSGLAFPVGRTTALNTDFVMVEAANRTLGASGEKLILARERQRLVDADREDLARRVEHVSVSRGDGLGYDISSFGNDGSPRLIEVKTTRRGRTWPMFVSRNEVAISRSRADHYVLARVFEFAGPSVGLFELPGAIEDTCLLEPESWRALPRAG